MVYNEYKLTTFHNEVLYTVGSWLDIMTRLFIMSLVYHTNVISNVILYLLKMTYYTVLVLSILIARNSS